MAQDSFKVKKSLNIDPTATAGASPQAGDLRVDSSNANKLKYHDGSSETTLATITGSLAASKAVATDSGGAITTSTTTDTELGYVAGVTSAIQTQINSKVNTSDAVSTNTASKVVARDGSGNFAAGTITAALTGNASTATSPASGSAHGAVTLDSSGHFQSVAPGTAGHVLRSNGTDYVDAAIQAGDIPTLNQNTTGTAAKPGTGSAHGAVTLDSSGNFQSVAPGSAGNYLRSNGTDYVQSTIQAGDVPTLNQNTTGTALNITASSNTSLTSLANLATVGTITSGTWTGATLAVANGGTGQITANAALNALLPSQGSANGKFLKSNGTDSSWAAAVNDPTTTLGDTLVRGSSSIQALAVGATNGMYYAADSTATNGISWQSPVSIQNYVVNGGFDYWQALGTSSTIANGISTYVPDQWYGKNGLGANGVLTLDQVTGTTAGSLYGARLKITTAPTSGQSNGCELWTVLDNATTVSSLYNQTASFAIQVKALGNVNAVGLEFFYATSETKPGTLINNEVSCPVSSGSFTLCKMENVALGTSMTTSGVVGVRIRIKTVSSGNTYDLNNGFIVEQAMLNTGTIALPFMRRGATTVEELPLCQRYFEKSYDPTVSPTTTGAAGWRGTATFTGNPQYDTPYKVTKRTAPTLTFYNSNSGATGSFRDESSNADVVVSGTTKNKLTGFTFFMTSATAGHQMAGDWVADSRI